jgi:2-oxoisovalerate dehydrogenase E1 component beta subunit
LGIEYELIDLKTLLFWDMDIGSSSAIKTGRLVVSHEAPITGGFVSEVVSKYYVST